MFFGSRSLAMLAAVGCLTATFGMSEAARAEAPASVMATPEMQAQMRSPEMQKGLALTRKGDGRGAAGYFRAAAGKGNPLAELVLGRMYYEGRGVPRNVPESFKWLKLAIASRREPTRTMAIDLLKDISASLRNSPNPQDRQMAVAAMLLPFAALAPKNGRGAAQGSSSGHDAFGAYIGHEMTDHAFDPFSSE